jgi:hypothetical protein
MAGPFQLPAWESLGDLASVSAVILIESREQNPLVFTRLEKPFRDVRER